MPTLRRAFPRCASDLLLAFSLLLLPVRAEAASCETFRFASARDVATLPGFGYARVVEQPVGKGLGPSVVVGWLRETAGDRSNLAVVNLDGEDEGDVVIRATPVPAGMTGGWALVQRVSGTAPFHLEVLPFGQLFLPDLVAELRLRGVEGLPERGGEIVGALFVEIENEPSDGLFLGARTSAGKTEGRYGVFCEAVPASEPERWLATVPAR